MKRTVKKKRSHTTVSQETIKKRPKPNWTWRDIREELKSLRKELTAHIKASDSKTEGFRMKCYAKIYELYAKCDNDDLEQIANLEKLINKADEREILWNGMVKKFAGVKKAQASKVVTVFKYADENDVPPLSFEEFVEKKGSLDACIKQYKKNHPKSQKHAKKKLKALKLVGKSGRLLAIREREGEFLARLTWDSEMGVVRVEKVYDENWSPRKKRGKREEAEDEQDPQAEDVSEDEEEAEGEESEEESEEVENLDDDWENEHRQTLRLEH